MDLFPDDRHADEVDKDAGGWTVARGVRLPAPAKEFGTDAARSMPPGAKADPVTMAVSVAELVTSVIKCWTERKAKAALERAGRHPHGLLAARLQNHVLRQLPPGSTTQEAAVVVEKAVAAAADPAKWNAFYPGDPTP